MSEYKSFKIEALNDHTTFRVLVKGWFGIWKSGYVWTDYFGCRYNSEQEALESIRKYKIRFVTA